MGTGRLYGEKRFHMTVIVGPYSVAVKLERLLAISYYLANQHYLQPSIAELKQWADYGKIIRILESGGHESRPSILIFQ